MATSEKSFNQVKAILGKLDRTIDEVRNRRTGSPAPAMPSPVQATPAPAPSPAVPANRSASPYGRATRIPNNGH
ncbi:MAG: hypothetical protein SFY96_07665 [Planctomycetota bacterium]|nr:hypothetical protein [Planctomycetota bacterium]